MSQADCQLDDFHFTRLAVRWYPPNESGHIEIEYGFDYKVGRHKTEKDRYRLAFTVSAKSSTPEPIGYLLDSEIVGFFRFPEGIDQKKADYLIRVNGCAILYGILRGQVANLTGNFPQKKLLLPSLMMREVVDGVEKQKEAQRKLKKPASKAPKAASVKKV
jgi:preprotein translocase subunit SecB